MQRIFNLRDWKTLREGQVMEFPGDRPRKVRLEVNAPGHSALYVVYGGEPVFLANVFGRDTIEFDSEGEFGLAVEGDGAGCFIFTADGDRIHTLVDEPVIFTKIAERRRRDPVIEMMRYEMRRNMEMMQQQQRAEIDALIAKTAAAQQPVQQPAAPAAAAEPEPAKPAPADEGGGTSATSEAGTGGTANAAAS